MWHTIVRRGVPENLGLVLMVLSLSLFPPLPAPPLSFSLTHVCVYTHVCSLHRERHMSACETVFDGDN